MALIESSQDQNVKAEVDRSFAALRAGLRPLEFRTKELAGGHYRTVLTTGLTTVLNAGDAIASLRWANAERLFVLERIKAMATLTAAFGTAQETSVDLVKLAGFTAPDTGGTAIVLGATCKKGPNMGASQVADLRVAGATALGAGTAAAEANALAKAVIPLGNTLGASASEMLFDHVAGVEHPLVLVALEGFRIRIAFTQGATGVVRLTFVFDWAEVPPPAF